MEVYQCDHTDAHNSGTTSNLWTNFYLKRNERMVETQQPNNKNFEYKIWKRKKREEKKNWFGMNQKAIFFAIVQVSVHRWKCIGFSQATAAAMNEWMNDDDDDDGHIK